MKEIKEFIEMIIEDYDDAGLDAAGCAPDKYSYQSGYLDAYNQIIESHEYTALKALADKPISKMEITDDMLDRALLAHDRLDLYAIPSEDDKADMRAALEAVFASMEAEELTSNDCWKIEAEELASMVLESTSLIGLQEVTRRNYPNLKPEQSATNAQGNDGWVKWNGGEQPVANKTKVEVKLRGGDEHFYKRTYAEQWRWEHLEGAGDIIAYRIIDEPKQPNTSWLICEVEGCKQRLLPLTSRCSDHRIIPEAKEEKKEMLIEGQREKAFNLQGKHVGYITVAHGKRYFEELKKEPKKQTLLEWILDTGDNLDIYTPHEIISLISEYLEQIK